MAKYYQIDGFFDLVDYEDGRKDSVLFDPIELPEDELNKLLDYFVWESDHGAIGKQYYFLSYREKAALYDQKIIAAAVSSICLYIDWWFTKGPIKDFVYPFALTVIVSADDAENAVKLAEMFISNKAMKRKGN